jgi:hypothetical protein
MKSRIHSQTEQQPQCADGRVDPSDEMAEAAEEFGDEPTVSNLRNLAAPAVSGDSDNGPFPTPTGAYRLVRPATSDRLDRGAPSPSAADKNRKKRTIIGVTRRR